MDCLLSLYQLYMNIYSYILLEWIKKSDERLDNPEDFLRLFSFKIFFDIFDIWVFDTNPKSDSKNSSKL